MAKIEYGYVRQVRDDLGRSFGYTPAVNYGKYTPAGSHRNLNHDRGISPKLLLRKQQGV